MSKKNKHDIHVEILGRVLINKPDGVYFTDDKVEAWLRKAMIKFLSAENEYGYVLVGMTKDYAASKGFLTKRREIF